MLYNDADLDKLVQSANEQVVPTVQSGHPRTLADIFKQGLDEGLIKPQPVYEPPYTKATK